MSDFGPYVPPDSENTDGPGSDQLAFAAYEDAWAERSRGDSADPSPLVAALKARGVPDSEYAEGTLLHRALFGSWERGRRPQRMHGVILGHRLRRTWRAIRSRA
jgi:hypothetical protein